MKKHIALITALSLLPTVALALDFQRAAADYEDVDRFSTAERVAISVLTEVGAVQGNPDGSFAPARTLNRAEFVKIALLSFPPSGPKDAEEPSCFPDVLNGQWFHPYVCSAKDAGIVQGNPDGLFHPGRAVNYAEALKILVGLAGYELPQPSPTERWAWYTAYLRAAERHGVALPTSIEPGHELTRGQMARLAAAFVAEKAGELDAYRDAEKGRFGQESSSSSSSSEESEASSVSSSSSSSSSSVKASQLPAKNSFLLSGGRTPLVLGGVTTSADEAAYLRVVKLVLRREVNSIARVHFVEDDGDVIAELLPATSDNNDHRKWEVFVSGSSYQFAANAPTKVGIAFDLDPKDGGGSSNELVEIESFTMQGEGVTSGNTKYLFLDSQVYPQHQTAFGRLTMAKSVLPASGTLKVGTQRQVASVKFDAETSTGGLVYVKGVDFLLMASDVTVSNFKIGDAQAGMLADCGVEKESETHVVCQLIPEGRAYVGGEGTILSVYADVSLPAPVDGRLNLVLTGRGRIGQAGSFLWTDQSGVFNWVEEDVPFGGNTGWTVVP